MKLKLALAIAVALAARGVPAQSAAPQTPTANPQPIPAATTPAQPVPALSPAAPPSPQQVPASPAPQAATKPTMGTADRFNVDFGGFLILSSFYDIGGLNVMDQARQASTAATNTFADENAAGIMVRQSRLRFGVGLPSDGFLEGAQLRGLAEFDFNAQQGANNAGEISSWMPRIRHAFVSATWKKAYDLQLLVGQTWGVAPGPYFAESVSHVATPRFGGAGMIYRRAPQVRLSGNLPVAEGFGFTYTTAVLTADIEQGQRSGSPQFEGRVSAKYSMAGKQVVDVGVFGLYGKERWEAYDATAAAAGTKTYKPVDVEPQLLGVDAKLNLPYVQLLAMYFGGENLDTYAATAVGVRTTSTPLAGASPATNLVTNVESVKTHGWFSQAAVTPVKGLMLVGGYGEETPDRDSYTKAGTSTFATATAPQITRNAQISGGAILNLTNRWRVGLEYTTYQTTYFYGTAAPQMYKTFESSQIELGTLYAF